MFRNNNSKTDGDGPRDEAAVLADIRYFESRLAELSDVQSARDAATAQVYRLLLRQRRQLLAAMRAGAPERWPEYAQTPDQED